MFIQQLVVCEAMSRCNGHCLVLHHQCLNLSSNTDSVFNRKRVVLNAKFINDSDEVLRKLRYRCTRKSGLGSQTVLQRF